MTKGESDNQLGPSDEGVPFGPYVLNRLIGRGGMAEVFLGHCIDEAPEKSPRVIKCILPTLSMDPQFLAMFTNEAQLAAQMKHPNIVQVLDFGEYEGRLYMAMEFVDGLDCWRFARRLYPWGEHHESLAVWIACRVLDALEYAHDMVDVNGRPLNVIHRDLSPSNIYLSTKGSVKLGDFGIAQIDSSRYREIKMIPKGKFGYVAPEQVEGLSIDQRADIFSMGVVLTELIIGKKMFSGTSQLSVMLAITEGRLNTLEKNVDRIDPALLRILLKALARDPDRRYESVVDFRQALVQFLGSKNYEPNPCDLGELVRQAVERGASQDSSKPAVQEDSPITMPERVASPQTGSSSKGADSDQLEKDGTPITKTSTPFRDNYKYSVKLEDGRRVGPTAYAHIIELIYSDQIGPDTMVSVDGRNYVPASHCPELNRHLPVYTPTSEMSEIDTPDRRGALHLETPSELLISLGIRRETGMLLCKKGQRRKEVYFRSGQTVYVSSNDSKELLGEYLVSRGILKREELELALALLPRFNGHMGDTIIALGMLSAVDLFRLIGQQIRTRFAELIGWGRGLYEFYKGVACRADILEMQFEVFTPVAECLMKASNELPVEKTLEEMAGCEVVQNEKLRLFIKRFDLPYEIETILKKSLGTQKVGDMTDSISDAKERKNYVRALYFAVETGFWKVKGTLPAWRSRDVNIS